MFAQLLSAVNEITKKDHLSTLVFITALCFSITEILKQSPQLGGVSMGITNNVVDTTSFFINGGFCFMPTFSADRTTDQALCDGRNA